MNGNNYFIKLIMLLIDDELILLYGFGSLTNQKAYGWKEKVGNEKGQYIFKSILNQKDAEIFFDKLKHPGKIILNKKEFMSPELFYRETVLCNDGLKKEQGPINKSKKLTELWNTKKDDLFNKIKISVDYNKMSDIDNYKSIYKLFTWIRDESGINLFSEGYRLGNFEIYYSLDNENDFRIDTHKDCGLLKTTVRKLEEFEDNLIVNCLSKHKMRTIINQTKIFLPEEDLIEFTSKEPMSEVLIQIWNEENGDLIFSENYTLILSFSINIGLSSPIFKIKDDWTQKLIKSATNRKEYIEENIETISHIQYRDPISKENEYRNEIDYAIEKGLKIFSIFYRNYSKGVFVKNENKDGEIESFIKIRKFIEASGVYKVVIVDPYFSVIAAKKILTRISRADLEIIIITALDKVNPDIGEKSDKNQAIILKSFLENNSQLISPRLTVINISRNKRQAFHDRYLLRYHKDGSVDGFLLSNSLNSMGQFYPFVIAPMNYEVCLEVSDYLDEITKSILNEEDKSMKSEVLYYSKNFLPVEYEKEYKELLCLEWFNRWKTDENVIIIPKEEIQEAIFTIFEKWEKDSRIACIMLCSLNKFLELRNPYKILANTIGKDDKFIEDFLNEFFILAEQIEFSINHLKKGLYSEENQLYLFLSNKAKLNRAGNKNLIYYGGHIYYGPSWLRSGYNLLIYLNSKKYFDLMDKLKSPMMFDVLIYQLTSYDFDNDFYQTFIEEGNINIQIFFADYFFNRIGHNNNFFERYKKILNLISNDKLIIQLTRMISRVRFYLRIKPIEENDIFFIIFDWILDLFAKKVIHCSHEIVKDAMYYLYDSETISHCNLHYEIGRRISNEIIKDKFFESALDIAEKGLMEALIDKTNIDYDFKELNKIYVDILGQLYENESESELLNRIYKREDFETATEPELKNYNYDKWHNAAISAIKQLEILRNYINKHPNSNRAEKIFNNWDERVKLAWLP